MFCQLRDFHLSHLLVFDHGNHLDDEQGSRRPGVRTVGGHKHQYQIRHLSPVRPDMENLVADMDVQFSHDFLDHRAPSFRPIDGSARPAHGGSTEQSS